MKSKKSIRASLTDFLGKHKAATLGLAGAILLGGLATGCGKNDIIKTYPGLISADSSVSQQTESLDSIETYYTFSDVTSLPSESQVAEKGITAEDVLALYDTMAFTLANKYYSKFADALGEDYENLRTRFQSIRPPYHTETGDSANDYYQEYYAYQDRYNGLVETSFNIEVRKGDQIGILPYPNIECDAGIFENVAKALGQESFEATLDWIDSFPGNKGRFVLPGLPAWNDFEITRDDIEKASAEELLNYYKMGVSIIMLKGKQDFDGNALKDMEYLIEEPEMSN